MAGEGERDHQRGRHQEIGFHAGMHAGFEVAVAAEHAGSNEIVLHHGLFDGRGERARVADTGRATVADEIEAQGVEVTL